MRILIYVPTIAFDGCVGNSVHVRELAQNLLELGNEVVVIANLGNPAYDGSVAVRSTWIPGIRVVGWLITQIQALFLVISEIIKNRCQLVYTRFGFSSGPCLLMARLTGIPCVIEVNGFPKDEARVSRVGLWDRMNSYLANWVGDRACRYAQHVVAVTPRIKEVLVATLGIKPEKIAVIPNGANTDLFRPVSSKQARERLDLDQAGRFVVFVGKLLAWQGLTYLTESVPRVLEECPDASFVIVGDGPRKEALVRLAAESGVSGRITFAGMVAYDTVPLYLNAADICVAPFVTERNEQSGVSPLKVYEYAACGKAVVASRLPGLEFIEQAKLGMLVDPEDPGALANGIIKLLQDPELRQQMGKNGRKYVVENRSWESVARRVAEVCQQAMEEHKAKRNKRRKL